MIKSGCNNNANMLIPLLLDAEEASRMLGISRSNFYALLSSGRIGPEPINLGKRVLWKRTDLELWVENDCPNRQKWLLIKEDRKITA